jgi:hypothetical protein
MTIEMELKNPADYFPYIGHELNQEKLLNYSLWRNVIGSLFDEKNITDNVNEIVLRGDEKVPLFREVITRGILDQQKIARDTFSVCTIVPRHRSLYDYGIGMPVHSRLINPEVMIPAGSNLFVAGYDTMLRHYGAFMFLREDCVLKRQGYPKVFLSIERYLKDVFPAYLNYQMFEGVGEKKLKRDMIVYAEQEKHPITKKRSGGRTKTGKLRELSPIIFDKFRHLTRESSTKLYISPVSVSFSKYPDATFIVHPVKHGGIVNDLRYVHEQNFVGSWYPHYSRKHPEAKLEVVVNYGKPELFNGEDYKSFHDVIKYAKELKKKIGLLESIFPTALLFRALGERTEMPLDQLSDECKKLYDHYCEMGIDVEKVSDGPGKMMDTGEIVDRAITTLNSNSAYRIYGTNTDIFIKYESGRFISLDEKLQRWYANTISHLNA